MLITLYGNRVSNGDDLCRRGLNLLKIAKVQSKMSK